MKAVIVIPTYNERENIAWLIRQIFLLNIAGLQILVVDDNSPDNTAGLVSELALEYPNQLYLLKRPGKLGLGSAYIAGFKWALEQGSDLIFEMDADGSHDPQDLPRLLSAIDSGADLAIGSRRVPGGGIINWGLHRHLASFAAMTLARLTLGLKTRDVTAGFRCYRRRVLATIGLAKIKTNGYAFQEEMVYLAEKNNFRVIEIPIKFKDREHGRSKLNYKDVLEFFATLFRLRRRNT